MPPFGSSVTILPNITGLHGVACCCPCFSDCFTCDLWTITGTGITIDCAVDEEVDWDNSGAGSFQNQGMSIDMICATVSDTAWVWRQKQEITCHTGTGNNQVYHGVSSVTGVNEADVQDQIGYRAVKATLCDWLNFFGCNVRLDTSSSSGNVIHITAACQTLYFEMKRLSATSFSVQPFNDACYSCCAGSAETDTICCGIMCLRYAKISNMFFSCTAQFKGHMDEIKFFDGVTCVP